VNTADKYAQTAAVMLRLLGGAGNVAWVAHCVTRLRVEIVDRSLVDDAALRAHPAVLGVIEEEGADARYQLVVGPAVVARLAEAFGSLVDAGNTSSV